MNSLAASMLYNLEVETMTKLRHPRVVTFFGAGELDEGYVSPTSDGMPAPPKGIFVVLEFVPDGDLQQVLERALGSNTLNAGTTVLPWQLRLQYALDIAEGMAFIHSKNLIHRDLKSLNVLVDHDGRCKIADLGLVRRIQMNVDPELGRSQSSSRSQSILSRLGRGLQAGTKRSSGSGGSRDSNGGGDSATKLQGTLQWMAPEVVDGGYDNKVDVFSFGIVMWEILTCRVPWENDERISFPNFVLVAMSEGQRPMVTEADLEQAPGEFVELMRACWAGLPSARPSFPTVLERLRYLAETLPQLPLGDDVEYEARLEQEAAALDAEMRRRAAALDFVGAERSKVELAAVRRMQHRGVAADGSGEIVPEV